jgi:hypothetical protein
MVGDVCLSRDDRDPLQPGQGYRQGYTHIGTHPQQALIAVLPRYVYCFYTVRKEFELSVIDY